MFPFPTFCEDKKSPIAMVVQVALLAERLLAERAENLEAQVLGSVVTVEIPSGGKQFEHFLLAKMLTHLRGNSCHPLVGCTNMRYRKDLINV